jgi:Leucine-rich repeat (LRR) protein
MMNDLVLNEDGHAVHPDDYEDEEDYYETTAGFSISGKSSKLTVRRGNTGLYMVFCGLLLIIAGVSVVISNQNNPEEAKSSNSGGGLKQRTDPPTPAPTSFEDGAFDLISNYVDTKNLKDDSSYIHSAYDWLMKNSNVRKYSDSKLKQRFSLAAVYFATNEGKNSWENEKGWISDDDECSWHGVKCLDDHVVGLNFTGNGLKGLVPYEISMLHNSLIALELGGNDIVNANEELKWIGKLTNLKLLDVEDTSLSADGIPSYIGKLSHLRVLDMAYTDFHGNLDGKIFKELHKLEYVDIGGISFNSKVPLELIKLPELKALYAYECGFEDKIDQVLPHFRKIFELWMDDNSLGGTIPGESLSVHTDIASLSLSDNKIEGTLPTEIGQLTNMEQMWFFGNYITGEIPSEIGQLTKLQILGIEDNDFGDETPVAMPEEICKLGLTALGADCLEEVTCADSCCTCCTPPCPVANLQLYKSSGQHFRQLIGL